MVSFTRSRPSVSSSLSPAECETDMTSSGKAHNPKIPGNWAYWLARSRMGHSLYTSYQTLMI